MNESYMKRAMELAILGLGSVKSNPLVGCVIVHKNEIIGEGYHQIYGGPHAEVNAIKSVINKDLIRESEVYINLEPCSHFGKTPPCVDLLIKYKPKKVIVSNLDPNPLVSGSGIEKLNKNNISVEIGLLEEEGRVLNKRFFTYIEKKRPYIILKWAETSDHFVAEGRNVPIQISDEYSNLLNHKWRSQEMGILIGAGTLISDNPKLSTREWKGSNPQVIILTNGEEIDRKYKIFESNNKPLLISDDKLEKALKVIFNNKISSIIVEGGPKTLQRFLDENLFDEIRIIRSKKRIQNGIGSPKISKDIIFDEIQLKTDTLLLNFQPFS